MGGVSGDGEISDYPGDLLRESSRDVGTERVIRVI